MSRAICEEWLSAWIVGLIYTKPWGSKLDQPRRKAAAAVLLQEMRRHNLTAGGLILTWAVRIEDSVAALDNGSLCEPFTASEKNEHIDPGQSLRCGRGPEPIPEFRVEDLETWGVSV